MNKPLLEQIKLPANADFGTYNLADDIHSVVAPITSGLSDASNKINRLENLIGARIPNIKYPLGDNIYEMLCVLNNNVQIMKDTLNHLKDGDVYLGNLVTEIAGIKARLEILETYAVTVER